MFEHVHSPYRRNCKIYWLPKDGKTIPGKTIALLCFAAAQKQSNYGGYISGSAVGFGPKKDGGQLNAYIAKTLVSHHRTFHVTSFCAIDEWLSLAFSFYFTGSRSASINRIFGKLGTLASSG